MSILINWLGRPSSRGLRRATFGNLANSGFEIGLFCCDSFKAGRTKLEGDGWRYWREPSYEAALREVVAWIVAQP